jgi:hypothetical protein
MTRTQLVKILLARGAKQEIAHTEELTGEVEVVISYGDWKITYWKNSSERKFHVESGDPELWGHRSWVGAGYLAERLGLVPNAPLRERLCTPMTVGEASLAASSVI